MTALHTSTLANVAEHLRDDEIHVWQVAYQRNQGRLPLCRVLAAYLGIDANAVMLLDGEHGRPALADHHGSSLGFNWSHSGDHALIGIARHLALGIDVEQVRARPHALDIARRFFSTEEATALAALPEAARSIAFLELWTAKEAVLKALGRGLAFGLHRLSISSSHPHPTLQQLEGEDIRAWQLQRLSFDPTLLAALAWRGEARQIRLHRLASTD